MVLMSFGGPNNSVVRDFVGGVRAASYWIGNRLLSASDIVNDSSVTGSDVKAALNFLLTNNNSMGTLVNSSDVTGLSYACTSGTMTPPAFITLTPTARKMYRIEAQIAGYFSSPAGTNGLALYVSAGSATGAYYRNTNRTGADGGTSGTISTGTSGQSVQMYQVTLYFYADTVSGLVVGLRATNNAANTFTVTTGKVSIYEL